jgi:hypothetical protein
MVNAKKIDEDGSLTHLVMDMGGVNGLDLTTMLRWV